MVLKLMVEVCSAHNLMPKDGMGSCNAYCVVMYDGQRRRTSTRMKDLNPAWNEKLEFQISNPNSMDMELLEVALYSQNSNEQRGKDPFLGRVRVPGSSFVRRGEEAIVSYPLEKRSFISHVRGELRMRVWYHDEIPSSKVSKEEKASGAPETVSVAAAAAATSDKTPAGVSSAAKAARVQERTPPTVVSASDYNLRGTTPMLASITGERATAYDLVEKMKFLYVRVVKARGLAAKDASGSSDPFVKLKFSEGRPAETMVIPKTLNPEWNQTFAFGLDKIQGPVLEVTLWDKDIASRDDFLGSVTFELLEVPTRVPPDSPLAPTWYRLEEKKGEFKGETRVKGEVMLAVWWGTQADEAFTEAWHSDTGGQHSHTRSKIYLSPKLWYMRVSVIEAQDLAASNKSRHPEVSVLVQLWNQTMRTRVSQTRNNSLNRAADDLLFVAAEPFEEPLQVTVEDHLGQGKEPLGAVKIPLNTIERRVDDRPVISKWYNLEKNGDKLFRGRIHLRLCFDGGYHVMDESTNHISDMRPTAKQLWKKALGELEVGIISGQNMLPMKTREGRGTTDAYCVAKYGPKWVRTRTIVDSFNPRWNEQYKWEVYDPCTVLTVGVFDNCHLLNNIAEKATGSSDAFIGKVRIRLSTLESDRVYTHLYPLLILQSSGMKKMGEIQLAVRFTCTSFLNVMQLYFKPPLPKMHYRHPLHVTHLENLRQAAIRIVSMRLARSEPPLRNEVVQYMLDTGSNRFSMRRSKTNYYRIMNIFSGAFAIIKWFNDICRWTNPITTVLVHILFLILVWYPGLILPTLFLYMFLIGAWHYRSRERAPPSMDAELSKAVGVDPDELDEEFDTFPTTKGHEVIRYRYEKLRALSGKIQTFLGDLASQGERFHALLSWRDPRATAIFITFCLIAAIVLYVVPFQVLAVFIGIYVLRHPRFRNRLPPVPLNFFRRLPSLADRIL